MKTRGSKHIFQLLSALFFAVIIPAVVEAETVVGILMTGKSNYYGEIHRAFTEEIKNTISPGEKIELIIQRPFPDSIALSNAARKLIAADVDIIVTYGLPATLAVNFEESGIPTVYAGVYEPLEFDISGDNITGCGYKVPLSSLLRHLKSLKNIVNLTVVYSSLEADSVKQSDELAGLTKQQNINLTKINVKSRKDIEKLNYKISTDAVFLTGSSLVDQWLNDILAVLKDSKLPSVFVLPDLYEAGVVLSLYQKPYDQGKIVAEFVARIIKGEKPKNIKAEILRDTQLEFNIREAKSLDVKVPINVISVATKVIK